MIAHPGNAGNHKVVLQSVHAIWDTACGAHHGDGRFHLSPEMVIERYELTHETEMTREPLRDWMAFESCRLDWDFHDFERMILGGIESDVYLFLVTDEGLMESSAFGFRRADFHDFAVWYESEYHMDFFSVVGLHRVRSRARVVEGASS